MSDIPTQAAEWLVKLSSEEPIPTAADFAEFERWKQASPEHAEAVSSMEKLLGKLEALPAEPSAFALDKVQQSNNDDQNWPALAKSLCLLLIVFLPLWLFFVQSPAVILADHKTGTGEWRQVRLPDNSLIKLSSNSAIDIRYDQQQRLITLIEGEIWVDVAKDKQRTFQIETDQGRFTALGTRFTVEHRDQNSSTLTVIESQVEAHQKSKNSRRILSQDQAVKLNQQGFGPIRNIDGENYEQAWFSHQLVVENQPLPEVLKKLSPHVSGYLYFDEESLAQYKVYAVLPLDDPQRALKLLTESFPIEVSELSPWFVQIKQK